MTNLRKIQSFVKRSGRLTPSQEKGLTELWDDYAIEPQGVFNFLASKFKKSCCTIRRLWCFFLCKGSGKNN
jgi:hypothetical protein